MRRHVLQVTVRGQPLDDGPRRRIWATSSARCRIQRFHTQDTEVGSKHKISDPEAGKAVGGSISRAPRVAGADAGGAGQCTADEQQEATAIQTQRRVPRTLRRIQRIQCTQSMVLGGTVTSYMHKPFEADVNGKQGSTRRLDKLRAQIALTQDQHATKIDEHKRRGPKSGESKANRKEEASVEDEGAEEDLLAKMQQKVLEDNTRLRMGLRLCCKQGPRRAHGAEWTRALWTW